MSNLDGYFKDDDKAMDELVQKYFETNERKKADEKWLKLNQPAIKAHMARAGKDKKDFGNYRVANVAPDVSKFDEEKVLDFLAEVLDEDDFDKVTTVKLKEDVLEEFINEGKVDIDALKLEAWVEAKGTPRMTITKIDEE